MAKTTTKRRSEGELNHTRKKKKHPAASSVSAADTGEDESEDSGEGHFVGNDQDDRYDREAKRHAKKGKDVKQPKKKVEKNRKSEPVRKVDEEYEEDEGRLESQQFLDLIKAGVKRKKEVAKTAGDFVKQFEASIASEEARLKEQLEKRFEEATQDSATFLSTFTLVFNASRPTQASSPIYASTQQVSIHPLKALSKTPILDFSTLHPRSQRLLSTAKSILSKYEAVAQITANMGFDDLLRNNWEVETTKAIRLIDIGREVGMRKVQAMLGCEDTSTSTKICDHEGELDEEMEKEVEGLFEGDQGDDDDAGEEGRERVDEHGEAVNWGRVAKKQIKAGRKLWKSAVVGKIGI